MTSMTLGNGAIFIAGGYGVVGAQAARILRDRNPSVRILIGGRDGDKAAALASELGNAAGVVFDIAAAANLLDSADEPIAAVLAAVNDGDNNLMHACISSKIPYVDITRWTDRVRTAVFDAAIADLNSPVVFSSSWMAGVPGALAAHYASDFAEVDSIDMDILYSLADQAGPNSIEYVDRLADPFPVIRDGKWVDVVGLSDPKDAVFLSGHKGSTYRFDAPDQVTLPEITKAKSVSTRITYDDQGTMDLMAELVSSGVWEKLSVPQFDEFRLSLLYNPGEGAVHEVTTTITGKGADGAAMKRVVMVSDPVSQTHMTATGAVIQIEHVLGLDGSEPRGSGIYFAENHRDLKVILATLESVGIKVQVK